MPATMAFASMPQLRQILRDIVNGEADSYILPCNDVHEASGLRGKLYKVRTGDRKEMERIYAESGQFVDTSAGISTWDSLSFRIEGTNVIVDKAPHSIEDLRALVRPVGTPPPAEREARQYNPTNNVIITNKRDDDDFPLGGIF